MAPGSINPGECMESIPVFDILKYQFPVSFRLKKENHVNGYFCKYSFYVWGSIQKMLKTLCDETENH
jgi:hypothetical protein